MTSIFLAEFDHLVSNHRWMVEFWLISSIISLSVAFLCWLCSFQMSVFCRKLFGILNSWVALLELLNVILAHLWNYILTSICSSCPLVKLNTFEYLLIFSKIFVCEACEGDRYIVCENERFLELFAKKMLYSVGDSILIYDHVR